MVGAQVSSIVETTGDQTAGYDNERSDTSDPSGEDTKRKSLDEEYKAGITDEIAEADECVRYSRV
jgi:hypothetical protein